MASRAERVVGLDLGTTKVCAVVGEVTSTGVDVIGVGAKPSKGMSKGEVIHIQAAGEAIRAAVDEAELMSGHEIRDVRVGIAGGHIRSMNSHAIVAVEDKEVREGDVRRVIDRARSVSVGDGGADRELLHVIPQEFTVDDQPGIANPIGMNARRMEARVHIVTASKAAVQNIRRACQAAGLNVVDMALQQLASAEAVLSDDERAMGVALLDIGGGTTDLAVFTRGAVVHTSVLALGGNHLTADIAHGLRTPREEAERLKHKYGCALRSLVAPDEEMDVPSVGGRPPRKRPRQALSEIVEARMDEILALARRELEALGLLEHLQSGLVLTGGSTLLAGINELAEDLFDMDVRGGLPRGVGGLPNVAASPKYATAVGLVLQAVPAATRQGTAQPGGVLQTSGGRSGSFLPLPSSFAAARPASFAFASSPGAPGGLSAQNLAATSAGMGGGGSGGWGVVGRIRTWLSEVF